MNNKLADVIIPEEAPELPGKREDGLSSSSSESSTLEKMENEERDQSPYIMTLEDE